MTGSQHGNGGLGERFRAAFKPRDVFLHDGRSLRRFTLGSRLQMATTGAVAAMVAWSGFATAQFATAMNSDMAQMQRRVVAMQQHVNAMRAETIERAALLERRQAFFQEMLSGRATPAQVARHLPGRPSTDAGDAAREISRSYSQVDGMQLMLAQQAQQVSRARIQRTAATVRRLGLDPNRFVAGGVGGPFEEAGADPVDPRFLQLFSTWQQAEQLEQGVASIPSVMPVRGVRYTSGFGVRSDPFRGRAAMHAGIDLAGPVGTPIYATADATVGRAGVSGGYGNVVELEHGAGISTRYGHMSRIMVGAGQRVVRGQVIGLMGSTGRSTGSHLHYEVRIDGHAVNPLPFLQSAEALAALQTRGSGAQGGR